MSDPTTPQESDGDAPSTMTAAECEMRAEHLLLALDGPMTAEQATAKAQAWATLALSMRVRSVGSELAQISELL